MKGILEGGDGVEMVSGSVSSKANSVFTLTGVKVSSHAGMLNLRSLPKGFYIVNDKKVLVK